MTRARLLVVLFLAPASLTRAEPPDTPAAHLLFLKITNSGHNETRY